MRRVLVLNNYPLERVWQEVRLRETPDHHLFGVNYFEERGYEPVIVPLQPIVRNRWRRLRIPIELGDLQQQRAALKALRPGDIVYAPCATQTHALQYLRALGVFRTPIVCLVHHPFIHGRADAIRGPQRRLFVKGADRLPSLSRSVAQALRDAGAGPNRTQALRWGPDAAYYRPQVCAGHGVVAAGRTGRDFTTLARAARRSGTDVLLIGLARQLRDDLLDADANVRVLPQPDQPPVPGKPIGWMKYPELLCHLSRARAVAIPLHRQTHLCGITSLMDALGLGKPVIMTRNPQIDLDVEALGIGIWVHPGDVDGWARALAWVDAHPTEAVAMGQRARALVDGGLSSRSFANALMDIFDGLVA